MPELPQLHRLIHREGRGQRVQFLLHDGGDLLTRLQ